MTPQEFHLLERGVKALERIAHILTVQERSRVSLLGANTFEEFKKAVLEEGKELDNNHNG
jgi:hypothetical protein